MLYYYLIITMACFSLTAYSSMWLAKQPTIEKDQKPNTTIDAREFLAHRPYNKQDDQGNTFLHHVALSCNRFSEWKDISHEMQQFADKNNGNMPNPLLENYDHATARKLAKAQFNKSGNPICGTLILFLREAEYMYLDRCSSQEGRRDLANK